MPADRIGALEALLTQAEAAHGVYESSELNGVYDEEWPRWYADYAIEHGIGALVGRTIMAGELADLLRTSWDDLQSAEPRPADSWATYAARRMAEQL
jgi:hypothetical protein